MAVSAVVADWSGARYLDGIDETLEEYMTKDRVEANMNTDEYALTAFVLNTDEGVIVQYRGKDYKFTVEITSRGNSAKVTYNEENDSDTSGDIPTNPEEPISKEWIQNDDGSITDGEIVLQIGDYINYNPLDGATELSYISSGTQNGYDDQIYNLSSYTYGWRVIGVEDGKIQIISEDNVANDTTSSGDFCIKGKSGFQNAITELDNISKLYGQGRYAENDTARSISIEDVNKLTGYDPDTTIYNEGNFGEYGNIIDFYWQGTDFPYYSTSNALTGNMYTSHNDNNYGNSFIWYDFDNESWNSSLYSNNASIDLKEKITTLEINYYNYKETEKLNNSPEIFDLLYFNTEGDSNNYEDARILAYWLSSRCVVFGGGTVTFGLRRVYYSFEDNDWGGISYLSLVHSNGNELPPSEGVRPIITLKANIKLNKNDDGSYDISDI